MILINSQNELRVKMQDEQYMRDYIKKLNPIQPKQSSFNRQNGNRNGNRNDNNMNGSNYQSQIEPSFTFSQLEQQEREQQQQFLYQQTGLDHLQNLSTGRHNSSESLSYKNKVRKINPQQKSCCNDGCTIF